MVDAPSLPIDAHLGELLAIVAGGSPLVLSAEPGAGKTTRLPAAMLRALPTGEVWVVQPRRIAACLAAHRVAAERGEAVGESVGYHVRHDRAAGPRTRLCFMTDGIFVRRLLSNPTLGGVAGVVIDEFHERTLGMDLALAWLRQLRGGARPDLRVVVMSATLPDGSLDAFIGGVRVDLAGRGFPVTVEFAAQRDERALEVQVRAAVRRALAETEHGHLLVFLPGVAEIERAAGLLGDLGLSAVHALHGKQPLAAQQRATRPGSGRHAILSTNVAESSITVDGVTAVIDSGLARLAQCDPWSGFTSLTLAPISRAAAEQRAGRAGRTEPGRAYRLFTRNDFAQRKAAESPEIARADLCELILWVAALGVSFDELLWLETPPRAALTAARDLLGRYGALDADGRLSARGQALLRLALHPRQGQLVEEARARGVLEEGVLAAVLLGELQAGLRGSARVAVASDSDLFAWRERFVRAERAGFSSAECQRQDLRVDVARRLAKDRDQLARAAGASRDALPLELRARDDLALRQAVLAAYPDRVAAREVGAGDRRGQVELRFAGGGRGKLADESTVRDAPYVVVLHAQRRDRASSSGASSMGTIATAVSAIEPEWLLEREREIVEVRETLWSAARERVERVERLRYGELTLDESKTPCPADAEAVAMLRSETRARGWANVVGSNEALDVEQTIARLHTLRPYVAQVPSFDADAVNALVDALCEGHTSWDALRGGRVTEAILAAVPRDVATQLDRIVPRTLTLPGGRRLHIQYAINQAPWVESFLQDFFGQRTGPRVCDGRQPLTLHLLAPNRRAVQVTNDLASFWSQHYPELRRQLARRYPKHAWPDDPLTAKPPAPRARRT